MRQKIICFFVGVIIAAYSNPCLAQQLPGVDDDLTEEQFAVELVKILELEHLLPQAALEVDNVHLLERIGVSPLKGWHPKSKLKKEDYLVIIGKIQGKERLIHKRALEVEEANIAMINRAWQNAYDREGTWPSLASLLSNQEYFPNGVPKSPYGTKYIDKDNNHTVDPLFSPIVNLLKLRESITAN